MARIMIVDDSMIARRILRKMLTDSGHEVICEAGDGISAIELYRHRRPDVVTMDINMPRLDGLLASEHIHAEFPDALIVMVTSVSVIERVCDAYRAGAAGYLLKPFTQEKVSEVIEVTLKRRESNRPAIPA